MNTTDAQIRYNERRRERQLRVFLRDKYGARKYRIVGHAPLQEIHVYGRMPNSIETGWYLLGSLRDVERNFCI